jgi:hypothetical protein
MTPLEVAARAWHRAKSRERDAAAALYAAIGDAHADGMPETQIAAVADVDRMTVRRALGKRR